MQFDDALTDWQTWLDAGQTATSPSHRTRLARFTTRYRLTAPPSDASTFLQELETVQHDSLRHVYFGATVIESDELLPVVAWIEGTRQAVFALSNPLGSPRPSSPATRTSSKPSSASPIASATPPLSDHRSQPLAQPPTPLPYTCNRNPREHPLAPGDPASLAVRN